MKRADLMRVVGDFIACNVVAGFAVVFAFLGLSRVFVESVAWEMLFSCGWAILLLSGVLLCLRAIRIFRRQESLNDARSCLALGVLISGSSGYVLCWLLSQVGFGVRL